MCLAGIEHDVGAILDRVHIATIIAAKAGVSVIGSKSEGGHFWLRVRDRGWVRSVDLLNEDPSIRLKRRVNAADAAASQIMSFA